MKARTKYGTIDPYKFAYSDGSAPGQHGAASFQLILQEEVLALHGVLKDVLMLLFVAATAVLFTLFTVYRPGANRPVSKSRIVGCLIVGVIIAGVLLASQHWNDPQSVL